MIFDKFKSVSSVYFHLGLAIVGVLSSVLVISFNSPKSINAGEVLYEEGNIQRQYVYDSYTINTDSLWGTLSINIENMNNGQNFLLYANYGSNPLENGGTINDFAYSSAYSYSSSQNINLYNGDIEDSTLYVVVYAQEGSGTYDYRVNVDDVDMITDTSSLVASENFQRYTIVTTSEWEGLRLDLAMNIGGAHLYANYGFDPTLIGGTLGDFTYSSTNDGYNSITLPSSDIQDGTLYILVALSQYDEADYTLTANSFEVNEISQVEVVNGIFNEDSYLYYKFNASTTADFIDLKLERDDGGYGCIYLTQQDELPEDTSYYSYSYCNYSLIELLHADGIDITGNWYIAFDSGSQGYNYTLSVNAGTYSDIVVSSTIEISAANTNHIELPITTVTEDDLILVYVTNKGTDIYNNGANSVSYNSNNFQSFNDSFNANALTYGQRGFYLTNPPVGSSNIIIDWPVQMDYVHVGAITLQGVDTDTPILNVNNFLNDFNVPQNPLILDAGGSIDEFKVATAIAFNGEDITRNYTGTTTELWTDIIETGISMAGVTGYNNYADLGSILNTAIEFKLNSDQASEYIGMISLIAREKSPLPGIVEDTTAPTLNVTTAPGNNAYTAATVNFQGTITDDVAIDYATYSVDGDTAQNINLTGGSTSKSFDFNIENLSSGVKNVVITAYDSAGNSDSDSFDFIVDSEQPFCDIPHQNPIVHANFVTYTNIVCTDNLAITGVDLRVYHSVIGDLYTRQALPQSAAVDGAFDEAEEIISFTTPVLLDDGGITIQIWPHDNAGNEPLHIGQDSFVVEAHDDTAPVVSLDEIRPDPIIDDTPVITGICGDTDLYDTNTFITSLEYRIDGGTWTAITPLDGGFGDQIERYSVELPQLSTAQHTVQVRCRDLESHSRTVSDTFTIIPPIDTEPTIVTKTEEFINHTNHSLSESNLIWGNGRLRLKEDVTTSRTLLDSNNYPSRYDPTYGKYMLKKDPLNSNRLWYVRSHEIVSRNLTTNVFTVLDPTSYGLPAFGPGIEWMELGVYQGKVYLWVSDGYSLYIINTTDNVGVNYSNINNVQSIALDYSRNRMAAYLKLDGNGAGELQIAYLNQNNTFSNTGDDVFQFLPTSIGINDFDMLGVFLDPQRNNLYLNNYGSGLYKYNDNNTPLNYGDDNVAFYPITDGSSVFSVIVDPNGKLIFGTAGNQTGSVFVVDNDNGTPFNVNDDTIIQLANPQKLNYLNVYGIHYLEGENGIGDQLILRGEIGDAYYINFNDTYSDLLDDTIIRLDILGNIRGSANLLVHNYNTIYANIDRAGLYRINLNRGWQNSGQAVIYSNPEDRLVTNYFELVDIQPQSNISLIAGTQPEESLWDKIASLLFPKVKAAGENISYSVSSDGGVTWNPITLAEVIRLSQSDYRVKFRVEMNKVNNSSPVLGAYTLAFGAYQDEEQAQVYSLNISTVPSSVNTSQNFTLTIKVVDQLGFTNTNYNGTINFNLLDANDSSIKSNLLNLNSINIVNGEGTLNNLQIFAPGSYVISSSFESNPYTSDTITVTNNAPAPTPSISFTANRYTINAGEIVTLSWNTQNLTSLSINRGIGQLNTLDGSINVSPTTTTAYTITGTGPYGNVEASLTITVNQPVSNTPATPPTPIDTDGDGLSDEEESQLGTNPNNPDSDNDGLLDGEEVNGCLYNSGTTTCSSITFTPTNPNNANTDNDSLLDGEEVKGCYFTIGTTTCSSTTFSPTNPNDANSPAALPVAENQESINNEILETTNPNQPEESNITTAEPNIITAIVDTVTTTAQSGTLPTALVVTTTTTTTLTAVAYPNFISYAFLWFRKRKKKSSWGLVYNSTNNKPIPFVTVRIFDTRNRFIAEEISDLNGKYSISAKQGDYILEAKINDYQVYKVSLTLTEESVNLDIPLIPINPQYNWKVSLRNWLKLNLPKINTVVFFAGFIFSVITVLISPSILNALIVVVFGIQIIIYYWIKRDRTGKVFDSNTNEKLKGIFVRVFEKESGRQLGSAITDINGKYNLFLKPGMYLVKVENLQYKISDNYAKLQDALGTPYVEVEMKKEGLLNVEIPMQRKSYQEYSNTTKFGYM